MRRSRPLSSPASALTHLPLALLLSAALSACAASGGKGDEDNPLGDGKADSFFSPTEHGQLVFGAPNQAAISPEELFHSWTFTLTGSAQLSIKTQIEKNLDTVMYLYRRQPGATSWGRYLRKNDDHDGQLFSQIDVNAGAGEYRVVVKGFKQSMLGSFSVLGSCTGDGCPRPGECVADEFGTLPDAGDFTQSCANTLVEMLATPGTDHAMSSAAEADVCSLGAPMKRGVNLFRAYWDDLEGWNQFTGGEPVSFEVERSSLGAASEVFVDTDQFDEDAITFLFDQGDQLLMLLQHNQSPDLRWFCAAPGEAAVPEPSCLEDMLPTLRHAQADVTDTGSATGTCADATTASLPLLVGDPLCEFTAAHGIADDAPVSIGYTTWRTGDGLLGAQVELSAGAARTSYLLGTTFGEHTVIFSATEDGVSTLPCLELE